MEIFRNSSAFSPVAGFQKSSKTTLAPTSFSEKVPYYSLPEGTSDENKKAVAQYFAYCGTSEERSVGKWKTWIVSWACLITPAFAGRLPATSFRRIDIGAQPLSAVVNAIGELERAWDTADRATIDNAGNAIKALTTLTLLPRIKENIDFALGNGEWLPKVVLCYYALVLFLAGKRIEGTDHSQLTEARPKALRGKAHINEPLDFLEGELKMSNTAHLEISNAWAEMGQLRSVVISEYAFYDTDDADMAKDIIWTTMHLLRFSQMAHALVTFNFLNAFPWAQEVPSLKTSIAIYTSSLKEAEKIDPKLFPFIKLIYGDRSGMFPRKEMEPLIACAVDTQTGTSSTLAEFYVNNTFNPVVDAFRQERLRRERIRDLGMQKKEKELTDYFNDDEVNEPTPDGSTSAAE